MDMRTGFVDDRAEPSPVASDPVERISGYVIAALVGAMVVRFITSPTPDPQMLAAKRHAAFCGAQPAAQRPVSCGAVMLPNERPFTRN